MGDSIVESFLEAGEDLSGEFQARSEVSEGLVTEGVDFSQGEAGQVFNFSLP